METKVAKTNLKTTQKMKSIRISIENQKKAEKYGPLSKDAFTGVMLTTEFSEFLKVTESAENVEQISA